MTFLYDFPALGQKKNKKSKEIQECFKSKEKYLNVILHGKA